MTRVLVIGASGGIGAALAADLEGRGVEVARLSRREDGLDLRDAASVVRAMGTLDGTFDGVFVATGILAPEGGAPEKAMAAVTPEAMAEVMAVNAIGPALILGQLERLLPSRSVASVGVLSARVGSIGDNGIGGWHSYRASKAALNQIVRGAAIELARKRPKACVVALHPGTVATPFTADYAARHGTVPPEDAARQLVDLMARLGPEETGRFYAYDGQEIPW